MRFHLVPLLVCALVCRAALPPAEKLLPADTLAFATTADWSATSSNFSSSALGQFLSDPAMKPLKEKFMSNFVQEKVGPLEKKLGVKLQDYSNLLRGQATLALTRKNWDGSRDKKPGFLWLIDTKDKAPQARTNLADLRRSWVDKGNKIRADRVRDIDFTTFIIPPDEPANAAGSGDSERSKKPDEPSELMIGQSDTLLVLSDSARDVEKVLALQAGSSVPALSEQASFAANAAMARDAGIFLWIDAKAIVSAMIKQAREERTAEAQPSLFGSPPTIDKVMMALGLAEVQTITASMSGGADGSMARVAVNVPESGRRGLFKILAIDQKDSSPPSFIPADAVKFSRWRIDLQKAWTTIENMMNEISPASGGVIKLLLDTAGKDRDPNFDLRKVLLANLGDDVITYEKTPRPDQNTAEPPALTLIGSKNAEQMAASLKALTSIIPPTMARFQEREFLGRKVYSFNWPSAGDPKGSVINYSASAGYLALSSDVSLLEEFLRSNDGKNRPLRDTPGLAEAAQKVGGLNTGFFSYENQKESMRASFDAAKKNPSDAISIPGSKALSSVMGGGKPASGMTNWFDASLLPAYDRVARYFHLNVTAINVSPTALTFKIFTPTPPQLRGQPGS